MSMKKKFAVVCIIRQPIEVEAETMEEALRIVSIEDVEANIALNGSYDYYFEPFSV